MIRKFLITVLLFLPLTLAFAAEPKAVLEESTYFFGTVKAGTKIKHDFKLRNEGSAPLKILDLAAS